MTCSFLGGGHRGRRQAMLMLRAKLLPLNITVQNTLTINHSLSIETSETSFIFISSHLPGTDQSISSFTKITHQRPVARAQPACIRRSWLSLWPLRGGCWSHPPWQQTTGKCRPMMDRSSPLQPSGPVCGRTVSLIPLGSPTAGTFLQWWHWRVSSVSFWGGGLWNTLSRVLSKHFLLSVCLNLISSVLITLALGQPLRNDFKKRNWNWICIILKRR